LPAHHRYDIIVSRAFASIPAFAAATARLLNPSGVWLALKGKVPTAEIDAVQGKVDVFHVERIAPPGLNEDRCLVWMRPLASP
jgi:16S rRNA (guanine527-N7)-methyltransferase